MATIAEVRAEIHRLTDLLMKKSKEYEEREALVTTLHKGRRITGALYTAKKNDVLLQDLSGASKTIATILTAYAAVLSAEVAWQESTLSNRVAPYMKRDGARVTQPLPAPPAPYNPGPYNPGPEGMRA